MANWSVELTRYHYKWGHVAAVCWVYNHLQSVHKNIWKKLKTNPVLRRRQWPSLSGETFYTSVNQNKTAIQMIRISLFLFYFFTFPCEPEDCQHWSLQSMRREAWLTDDETLRLFTARDQSSISIPRWLLWCFFNCFPERPQKAGDWPGCRDHKWHVDKHSLTEKKKSGMLSWWMCDWPGSLILPKECLVLCLRVLKQFSQKSKSSQFLHLNLGPLMGNIWQPSHLWTAEGMHLHDIQRYTVDCRNRNCVFTSRQDEH